VLKVREHFRGDVFCGWTGAPDLPIEFTEKDRLESVSVICGRLNRNGSSPEEPLCKVASEHGLLTAQALFGTSESCAEIKRAFAAHRVKFIGVFLQDFEKVKAIYCEVNLNLLEIGSIILEKEAMIPGLQLGRSQLLQRDLECVQAM